jgi:hypothetical protein
MFVREFVKQGSGNKHPAQQHFPSSYPDTKHIHTSTRSPLIPSADHGILGRLEVASPPPQHGRRPAYCRTGRRRDFRAQTGTRGQHDVHNLRRRLVHERKGLHRYVSTFIVLVVSPHHALQLCAPPPTQTKSVRVMCASASACLRSRFQRAQCGVCVHSHVRRGQRSHLHF